MEVQKLIYHWKTLNLFLLIRRTSDISWIFQINFLKRVEEIELITNTLLESYNLNYSLELIKTKIAEKNNSTNFSLRHNESSESLTQEMIQDSVSFGELKHNIFMYISQFLFSKRDTKES